jgi:Cu/Ag efflux pump CusA
MALALESGGELMQPLAIVVIGGLTFSTFMTLILIPVIYEWAEQRKR